LNAVAVGLACCLGASPGSWSVEVAHVPPIHSGDFMIVLLVIQFFEFKIFFNWDPEDKLLKKVSGLSKLNNIIINIK
jgi:hypothetical protein